MRLGGSRLDQAAGPRNPFVLTAGSSVQNTVENGCVPDRPM
jgi:hypothetical protein